MIDKPKKVTKSRVKTIVVREMKWDCGDENHHHRLESTALKCLIRQHKAAVDQSKPVEEQDGRRLSQADRVKLYFSITAQIAKGRHVHHVAREFGVTSTRANRAAVYTAEAIYCELRSMNDLHLYPDSTKYTIRGVKFVKANKEYFEREVEDRLHRWFELGEPLPPSKRHLRAIREQEWRDRMDARLRIANQD